jgi:hypothetical protein
MVRTKNIYEEVKMKQIAKKYIVLIALLYSISLVAQPVGSICGIVTDGASGQALPYVSVVVLNSNPVIGTTTDENGNFTLSNLPVGRYDIQSSFVGYEPSVFREILVSSAREVFLAIVMRENIQLLDEIVVRPRVNKEAPLNEMALAGARMLSVEEASRYAGGFDDPARLTTAFAGVAGGVSSNAISIRGNSPQFLQWRLENVEAVNPTHFSDVSGVGGGILTALSAQMLGNSDFLMSAFPAEFGNALSGIFDMQLRNGNNQNYEHTAQIGTLGVEFASEGPFKKGGKASYLFNYRYSSLALVGDLFPDWAGDAGGIRYQDLAFKMNFPTQRAGIFSVYGFGTKDHFGQHNDTPDYKELGKDDFWQTKGVGGVEHKIFLGEKTYLKSSLSANYSLNEVEVNRFYNDIDNRTIDMKNTNWNVAFNSFLNTKFNSKHTNRTGVTVIGLFYDLDYWLVEDPYRIPSGEMRNVAKNSGNAMAYSAYSQSSFRLNNCLTANVGLHGTYFSLNEKAVIEPRASIRWQAFPKHSFGVAYGKHSRRENTDYYFVKTPLTGDKLVNQNLDFAKVHHFVLSYDWAVSENLHLKVEPYLQLLYDIPVGGDGTMSIINHRDFWMLNALTNEGKGRNFGVDFTLERYLYNGYYYLITASLFESRYTGSDGVWRNTRLNRNFVVNALGGKEWKMGRNKQNILSVNIRTTLQGGEHYTPFDEVASIATQSIVYDHSQAYEMQLSPQFISSFTISYKINKNKLAHEFALKMINVTNTQELQGAMFNYRTNRPELQMGATAIPNISYKIEF